MKINNKILFLIHLPPPVHGSSIVGFNIRESKIINETFDCHYINLLTSLNVAESGKITLKKIAGFISTAFIVMRSIIINRPQLCYLALTTTKSAFYRDVILVTLLKLFCIKRVYHIHNKGVSQYQSKKIHRLCYHFVFKNANVIILSKHLYTDIAMFVPEEKVHICPNGIADQGIRQLAKDKVDTTIQESGVETQESRVKILFLSNLIESKGVFLLLEALSLLKQKGISFVGNFIGSEGDITVKDFSVKVASLKITKQVNYLGEKYGKEKERAFQDADIFIHPSYSDCFPLVLIEAMQHSLPLISTYEGGIPDLVEDGKTGFLVPQKNTEVLAEKLEILISNPGLRQQMGAAGRKKYEEAFTSEIFENRFVNILHKIIEKG